MSLPLILQLKIITIQESGPINITINGETNTTMTFEWKHANEPRMTPRGPTDLCITMNRAEL